MGIISSFFGERPTPPQTGGFTVGAEIPKELAPFYKDILSKSQALYDDSVSRGYQPYTGPSLAEFTPEQQQAFTGLSGLQGTTAPVFQEAMQMTREAAAPITGEQIEEYMNPYQQAVVDIEKREATKQYESQVQPQLAAKAAMIQPFGGSRQAILEGMAADTQQRLLGDIQAKGSAQAYQDSVNLLNQQRMQQGQAAGQLATMAPNQFKTRLGELGALQTVGEEKQQLSQQALNEAYGQYLKEQEYPYQQLGRYQSVVTGAPIQGTTYVPPTPPPPSMANQLISGLGTLGATYGAFGGFSPGGFMGMNKTAKTGGGIADIMVYRKTNNKVGYPKGGNWGGDSAFPHPDIGGHEKIPRKPYGFSMRDLLAKYNIDPRLYEYNTEYVPKQIKKERVLTPWLSGEKPTVDEFDMTSSETGYDALKKRRDLERAEEIKAGVLPPWKHGEKPIVDEYDMTSSKSGYHALDKHRDLERAAAIVDEQKRIATEQAVIDAAGPTKHPLEVFSKYKGTGFDTSPAKVKNIRGEPITDLEGVGHIVYDEGPLRKVKREHTAGEGQHYGMETEPLANLTPEEHNNLLVERKREEAAAIVAEQERKDQELLDIQNKAKILTDKANAKKDKDEPGEDKPDVYADATAAEDEYLLALGNREKRIQGDLDKIDIQEREAQFGNLAMMFARLGTKSGPLLSSLIEVTGEVLPAALKTKNEFTKETRRLETAVEDAQLGKLQTVAEFKKARAKLKSATAQKVLENSWKRREVEVKEDKAETERLEALGLKLDKATKPNETLLKEVKLNMNQYMFKGNTDKIRENAPILYKTLKTLPLNSGEKELTDSQINNFISTISNDQFSQLHIFRYVDRKEREARARKTDFNRSVATKEGILDLLKKYPNDLYSSWALGYDKII